MHRIHILNSISKDRDIFYFDEKIFSAKSLNGFILFSHVFILRFNVS